MAIDLHDRWAFNYERWSATTRMAQIYPMEDWGRSAWINHALALGYRVVYGSQEHPDRWTAWAQVWCMRQQALVIERHASTERGARAIPTLERGWTETTAVIAACRALLPTTDAMLRGLDRTRLN